MKKIILGVAAAAMTLASGSALAQPYYGYQGSDRGAYDQRSRDSDRDGRSDRSEWNRDRDRDDRPDQYDRNDNRRGGPHYGQNYRGDRGHHYGQSYQGGGYRGDGRWRQGQVYPHYRSRGYVIDDYRSYNLGPPRPGYRYYRSDNGDVVMAAIASGLIGLVIGGALSDNNDHHRGGYYPR